MVGTKLIPNSLTMDPFYAIAMSLAAIADSLVSSSYGQMIRTFKMVDNSLMATEFTLDSKGMTRTTLRRLALTHYTNLTIASIEFIMCVFSQILFPMPNMSTKSRESMFDFSLNLALSSFFRSVRICLVNCRLTIILLFLLKLC